MKWKKTRLAEIKLAEKKRIAEAKIAETIRQEAKAKKCWLGRRLKKKRMRHKK